MPKKLINKNEKKNRKKKNQRSLHTGTYQTKNKKSLSVPKKIKLKITRKNYKGEQKQEV